MPRSTPWSPPPAVRSARCPVVSAVAVPASSSSVLPALSMPSITSTPAPPRLAPTRSARARRQRRSNRPRRATGRRTARPFGVGHRRVEIDDGRVELADRGGLVGRLPHRVADHAEGTRHLGRRAVDVAGVGDDHGRRRVEDQRRLGGRRQDRNRRHARPSGGRRSGVGRCDRPARRLAGVAVVVVVDRSQDQEPGDDSHDGQHDGQSAACGCTAVTARGRRPTGPGPAPSGTSVLMRLRLPDHPCRSRAVHGAAEGDAAAADGPRVDRVPSPQAVRPDRSARHSSRRPNTESRADQDILRLVVVPPRALEVEHGLLAFGHHVRQLRRRAEVRHKDPRPRRSDDGYTFARWIARPPTVLDRCRRRIVLGQDHDRRAPGRARRCRAPLADQARLLLRRAPRRAARASAAPSTTTIPTPSTGRCSTTTSPPSPPGRRCRCRSTTTRTTTARGEVRIVQPGPHRGRRGDPRALGADPARALRPQGVRRYRRRHPPDPAPPARRRRARAHAGEHHRRSTSTTVRRATSSSSSRASATPT